MIKVAINGFGRIGRHVFKVANAREDMEVVAVNDLTDNKTLAHLLKHDTAYQEYPGKVEFDEESITVDGTQIKAFAEKDPAALPWGDLDIDVVVESTGFFRTKEKASLHLKAGAKKVIISAPAKGGDVKGFVRGVNCESYAGEDVIDVASCTSNCSAPVMRVLQQEFGVEKALMSTIHSYTTDQNLQDGPHSDLRRARAAAQNIIPTTTGAAIAVTKVIPELDNKFDGIALRVPTITVSLTDFTVLLSKDVTIEDVNNAMAKAAGSYLKGILDVSSEPLVSSDYIGNAYSSIVDLELTKVVGGNLVKIVAWYDNEWGYANRMVEMIEKVGAKM